MRIYFIPFLDFIFSAGYADIVESVDIIDVFRWLFTLFISSGLLQSNNMYAKRGSIGHKTNANTEMKISEIDW